MLLFSFYVFFVCCFSFDLYLYWCDLVCFFRLGYSGFVIWLVVCCSAVAVDCFSAARCVLGWFGYCGFFGLLCLWCDCRVASLPGST